MNSPTDERRMNDASTDERPQNDESIDERFHLLSMAEMRRAPCVTTLALMAFHTPVRMASYVPGKAALYTSMKVESPKAPVEET